MSEFTDELKRLDLAINLPSKTYFAIEEKFKDWQPPKPLVEVPQIVADWFEDSMEGTFAGVISSYAFNDIEAVKLVQGNGGIDLLCRMKLDGYTVKKEKLYYIKIKKTGASYLNLRIDTGDVVFADNEDYNIYKTKFTEQEIKDIDERYWAFAVKVDGVEP